MADHIAAVCHSGFFQLRQLRCIKESLTPTATKTLVHAYISSHLDYFKQLFVGVSGWLLYKLQSSRMLLRGTESLIALHL